MTDEAGASDGGGPGCTGCVGRQAEIDLLRARVRQLEAANAALRSSADRRDYERPPHWE